MLVLDLGVGPEKELIITLDGKKITLTVLALNSHHAKVGIDAPQEVRIDRKKIYNRKIRSGFYV